MGVLQEVLALHKWGALLLVIVSQHHLMTSADEAPPPTMEKSIIKINITEGRTAILPCMVKTITQETSNRYKVTWLNPQKQMISYGTNIVLNDRRYSIVRPFPADWNLRISRVRGQDAGQYVCQLKPEPVQEKTVFLYVQVPPSITSSGDVVISEGRNLQIFCNVIGKPKPSLTWYKDGKVLPELKEEIVIIENISRHMAGAFTCLASNGVEPNVTKTISVTVQFRPQVTVYSKRIGQYRYKEVILVCMIIESPPGKVTWYKEGKPLKQDWKYAVETVAGTAEHQRYLRVKIRQLQSEDFGEYTCVAQNTVGYDEASMTVYEMTTPPPVTSTRNDVKLTTHAPFGTTMDVYSGDKGEKETDVDGEYSGKAGKHGLILVTDNDSPNNTSPTTLGIDARLVYAIAFFYMYLHGHCMYSTT